MFPAIAIHEAVRRPACAGLPHRCAPRNDGRRAAPRRDGGRGVAGTKGAVRRCRKPAAGFYVHVRGCVLLDGFFDRHVIGQWNVHFHIKHASSLGIFLAEELNMRNSIGIFPAEELNMRNSNGIFPAEELSMKNSIGILYAEELKQQKFHWNFT